MTSTFLARDRWERSRSSTRTGPRGFAFASELKVIRGLELQEVPICQALEFYFDEHTPFRGVHSVRPGRVPRLHARRSIGAARQLVALPAVRADDRRREVGARQQLLDLLQDSCGIRKMPTCR
jgi:asparagine synthetase B (glutamine-hydrolysing)